MNKKINKYKLLVILFLLRIMCNSSANAELFYNNLITLVGLNNNILDALGYVNGDYALKNYYRSIINNIEQGIIWINPNMGINGFGIKDSSGNKGKLFLSPGDFITNEDVVSDLNLSLSYGYNNVYNDKLIFGISGINSFLATGSNELRLTTRIYNFGIGTYLRYYVNNDKTLYSNIVISYLRNNNEITPDSLVRPYLKGIEEKYKTNDFDIHADIRYNMLSDKNINLTFITDLNKIIIYDSTNKRTIDSLYLVPGIEVALFNNILGFKLDYRALLNTNVKDGLPGIYNILDLTNRFDLSVNLGFNIGKHFNLYYSFKYPFSKYYIINNHNIGFNIRF